MHKLPSKLAYSIYIFLLISLLACKKEADKLPEAQYLVSADLIKEVSKEEVKFAAQQLPGFPAIFLSIFQNDLKAYKIVYKTINYDGTMIQASGCLLIPKTNTALSLVSHQHGTLDEGTGDNSDAPSYFNNGSESFIPGILFASAGYVISIPDYIGYGSSKNLAHPYEHGASLATASRDMLRAAREFCERNNVQLNKKLFLAGYSEGGFATMNLHKLLEENHADEFSITAAAPGAGAYDKTAFGQYILNMNQELDFLPTYLWVLITYNQTYHINRPLNQIFNEPYATQLSNGNYNQVSKNPQTLFKVSFIENIKNQTDTPFINAFKANDVFDWKPKSPLKLVHGTADDFVPFFNSQNAYDAMQARGASQVSLYSINGGNHFTSTVEYNLVVYSFFETFK